MNTPQLSHCFFQVFLEDKAYPGYQPILQIVETRPMQLQQGQNQIRVRLSDGIFTYSGGIITQPIVGRFESDQLTMQNGIIQVTKWKKTYGSGKVTFSVNDYELITTDFPVIGNPQPHTGRTDEYHDQMQMYQQQIREMQQAGSSSNANRWDQSPSQHGAENTWGSTSAKRPRDSSASDSRQPLVKRQQPSNTGGAIVPISFITPYVNKWRICGIVSAKDDKIKEINNARGTFRVFGFIITDKAGTSIRVSAFGDNADRVFPNLENGGIYYISGGTRAGSVKAANKQFSNTGHDYEIVLDRDSEVVYCYEQFDPPKVKFRPVILANVPKRNNECIDVQAVIERIDEPSQVTSRKDQQQLNKRDIYLVDKTGTEVRYTLWGDDALNFKVKQGTVVGIKAAVVREFNGGYSLSSGSGSQIVENPDGEYTKELYIWYREQKPSQEIKTLSIAADSSLSLDRDFRLIGQIIQHGLNRENEKGNSFLIKAMISAIKSEQAIYQACPKKGCKKKVTMEGNGYRCEKCNEEFDHYKNVMMLRCELTDFTGSTWVTLFDETATNLLGSTAEELAELQSNDALQFDMELNKIRFQEFLFRVGIRYETYNDNQQMKWSVFDVKPVPYEKCKQIYENTLQELQKMEAPKQQQYDSHDSFYD